MCGDGALRLLFDEFDGENFDSQQPHRIVSRIEWARKPSDRRVRMKR